MSCWGLAGAAPPPRIDFVGHLTDLDDQPITAQAAVTTKLCTSATVGAADCHWTDTFQIDVDAGAMPLSLGSGAPLPYDQLAGEVWLEITIDDTVLGRTPLTSVPYAYSTYRAEVCASAEGLGGLSAADVSERLQALESGAAGGGSGPKACIPACDPGHLCDPATGQCACAGPAECTEPGQVYCAGTARRVCLAPDGSGCFGSEALPCPAGSVCDAETGGCTCQHAPGCAEDGQVGCAGDTPYRCEHADGDGCLDRVDLSPCDSAAETCDDATGTCTCKHACAPGTTGCLGGNQIWACETVAGEACRQQVPQGFCPTNSSCQAGQCVCNAQQPVYDCSDMDVMTFSASQCSDEIVSTQCGLGDCGHGACAPLRHELLPNLGTVSFMSIATVEHQGAVRALIATGPDRRLHVYDVLSPPWLVTRLPFQPTAVDGAVGGDGVLHLFAAGPFGQFAHHDGTQWRVESLPAATEPRALVALDTEQVVVAGSLGALLVRTAAKQWSGLALPLGGNPQDVLLNAAELASGPSGPRLWVVGEDATGEGLVLEMQVNTEALADSPVYDRSPDGAPPLQAVAIGETVFVGGAAGYVGQRIGVSWIGLPPPSGSTVVSGVHVTLGGDVLAISSGKVYRYGGAAWTSALNEQFMWHIVGPRSDPVWPVELWGEDRSHRVILEQGARREPSISSFLVTLSTNGGGKHRFFLDSGRVWQKLAGEHHYRWAVQPANGTFTRLWAGQGRVVATGTNRQLWEFDPEGDAWSERSAELLELTTNNSNTVEWYGRFGDIEVLLLDGEYRAQSKGIWTSMTSAQAEQTIRLGGGWTHAFSPLTVAPNEVGYSGRWTAQKPLKFAFYPSSGAGSQGFNLTSWFENAVRMAGGQPGEYICGNHCTKDESKMEVHAVRTTGLGLEAVFLVRPRVDHDSYTAPYVLVGFHRTTGAKVLRVPNAVGRSCAATQLSLSGDDSHIYVTCRHGDRLTIRVPIASLAP